MSDDTKALVFTLFIIVGIPVISGAVYSAYEKDKETEIMLACYEAAKINPNIKCEVK